MIRLYIPQVWGQKLSQVLYVSREGFSKHPLLSLNQILAVSGSIAMRWAEAVQGVSVICSLIHHKQYGYHSYYQ